MSAQECSMLTAMRSGSSSPTITDASNLMMRFKPVDGECDAATDVRCGRCCCWRWWWRLHLCVTCTPSLMTAAHRKRRQVRWPSSCFFEGRHVFRRSARDNLAVLSPMFYQITMATASIKSRMFHCIGRKLILPLPQNFCQVELKTLHFFP